MIRNVTGLPRRGVAWNPSHPGFGHTEGLPARFLIRRYLEMGNQTEALQAAYARPANSRVSVLTFMDSPSLTKNGTWISIPVSNFAGLVTAPLAVLPRTPGSVYSTLSSTCWGS